MVQFAQHSPDAPGTLPEWLQRQAADHGTRLALRHKHLGVWQVRTWQQLADEVRRLASALQLRGFTEANTLVVLSRPRPEALIAALAAQWLGGVAVLFDPLQGGAAQVELLRELNPGYFFAEGAEELAQVGAANLNAALLFYADGRGLAAEHAETALDYAVLVARAADPALKLKARTERSAFIFYRLHEGQHIELQRISHAELVREGARLVQLEHLGPGEEALAARAFAASGQARYLLAPWLIAGFRLNFPESLHTRDRDRRELGPTLVAGTRETYGRLHQEVLARLPDEGTWQRRLVDWALAAQPGVLRRVLGYWLVRRALRDILGFSRIQAPLLVGEPLAEPAQAFFAALDIRVRAWPDPARWQVAPSEPASRISGWIDDHPQLA